jgi:hypothetical protein
MVTIADSIYERTASAAAQDDKQIFADVEIDARASKGLTQDQVQWSSSNEAVATVNGTGLITHTNSNTTGTATITGSTALLTKAKTITFTRLGGSNIDVFQGYAAGSLAKHISDAMAALVAASSPAQRNIFSSAVTGAPASYARNSSFWLGHPLTCLGVQQNVNFTPNQLGFTAITSRHCVAAKHTYIGHAGSIIKFVTADGTIISRTSTGFIEPGGDLLIFTLDTDLPTSIVPAKVLPANAVSYLPTLRNKLPILTTNQGKIVGVSALYALGQEYLVDGYRVGPYSTWSQSITYGDSGHPVFLWINNSPVLVGSWYRSNGGAALHAYRTLVNDYVAISGHSVSEVNLSEFAVY